MKALSVFYGGLAEEDLSHLEPKFPGVEKTLFFGIEGDSRELPPGVEAVLRPAWTKKSLLEEIARAASGYDLVYFAWADCPLLDPALAAALAERHTRYAAEYSYADGWPYGFAPELLAPGTAGILAKILGNDDGAIGRDALFSVIKKDINAFDIETEISDIDLRHYRLSLNTDSKRNRLLVSRFIEAGVTSASQAAPLINEKPELLRSLPAFFNIQVSAACPQACSLCPWPSHGAKDGTPVGERTGFMPKAAFSDLLDKIADFAGDAVISLSLWGELALHPEKMELAEMVLSRPALSLLVETSGIGWKVEELEALAKAASLSAPRKNHQAPLSWIVSLDAHDPQRYREIRGPGYAEARECAKRLLELFPRDAYVQAVRVKGFEDDIERFYRAWKDEDLPRQLIDAGRNDGSHIIIQKYDDFAGALPKLQASDLSPVKRRPCWHIQRDMNILLDGRVPCCRQDLAALTGNGGKPVWGNAFTEELGDIWEKGMDVYREHCAREYKGICANCDEYYTYNF